MVFFRTFFKHGGPDSIEIWWWWWSSSSWKTRRRPDGLCERNTNKHPRPWRCGAIWIPHSRSLTAPTWLLLFTLPHPWRSNFIWRLNCYFTLHFLGTNEQSQLKRYFYWFRTIRGEGGKKRVDRGSRLVTCSLQETRTICWTWTAEEEEEGGGGKGKRNQGVSILSGERSRELEGSHDKNNFPYLWCVRVYMIVDMLSCRWRDDNKRRSCRGYRLLLFLSRRRKKGRIRDFFLMPPGIPKRKWD